MNRDMFAIPLKTIVPPKKKARNNPGLLCLR
jgi:hypothetical protein